MAVTYTYPPTQAGFFQNDPYKPLSVAWTSWFNRIAILSGEGAVLAGENVGSGGIGVFKQRSDTYLQFKNIIALDSSITVTASGNNIQIGAATQTTVATQAEMETDTSTTVRVTPGRVKYSPGIAKAWVRFNIGSGVLGSYNITSVTNNAAGDNTITFDTDFSTANYALSVFAGNNTGVVSQIISNTTASAPAAGTCRILTGTSDAAGTMVLNDEPVISAVFYGDFT